MEVKYSYPSLSYNINNYYIQRQIIAYLYIVFSFFDILTTYFGINNYGLVENIPWTQWIINNYGWNGVVLRFIIFSIFFLYLFRYQPDWMFKYFRYLAFIILIVFAYFTSINNLFLMWW